MIFYTLVISSESVTFVRDRSRHTCLGYWFYRRFSGDMARPSAGISHDDNSSGGELLTESDGDTMNEDDNEVNSPSILDMICFNLAVDVPGPTTCSRAIFYARVMISSC